MERVGKITLTYVVSFLVLYFFVSAPLEMSIIAAFGLGTASIFLLKQDEFTTECMKTIAANQHIRYNVTIPPTRPHETQKRVGGKIQGSKFAKVQQRRKSGLYGSSTNESSPNFSRKPKINDYGYRDGKKTFRDLL